MVVSRLLVRLCVIWVRKLVEVGVISIKLVCCDRLIWVIVFGI